MSVLAAFAQKAGVPTSQVNVACAAGSIVYTVETTFLPSAADQFRGRNFLVQLRNAAATGDSSAILDPNAGYDASTFGQPLLGEVLLVGTSTLAPSACPTTVSPHTLAPTTTQADADESFESSGGFVVGLSVGVSTAAVLTAILGFAFYRRRKRRRLDKRGDFGPIGGGKGDYDKKKQNVAFEQTMQALLETDVALPEPIDIFSGLEQQDTQQWHKAFGSFIMGVETREKIRELLGLFGRAWKCRLFEFLTKTLASIDDFEVIDEVTGRVASFKSKLVALAVTVLSTIDAEVFLPSRGEDATASKETRSSSRRQMYRRDFEKKLDQRLVDSFSLIAEACKFGSSGQERSIRALLLFTLVNKVKHSLFLTRGAARNRAPSLSALQWLRVIQLFREVLRVVLAPHPRLIFHLASEGGAFADIGLVRASATFLSNSALTRMLDADAIADMAASAKSRAARKAVRRRARALKALSGLFVDLLAFMEKVQLCLQKDRKRQMLRARIGSRTGSGRGSTQSPSLARHIQSNQKDGSARDQTEGARSVTELTRKLIERLAAEIKVGPNQQVAEAIIFSVDKIENSASMQPLQALADAALGDGRVSFAPKSRAGTKELQMLLKPQAEELDRQILAKNQMGVGAEDSRLYRARLSGVLVCVRLLKASVISPRVKAGLLLHQKLSTSPFVIQMFGVGYSPKNGWFVAMELIERSLEELIEAWPPMRPSRLVRIAVDIASGFAYLHDAGIYHRDVGPSCILVTNTLQVKIADFSISEDMAGGNQTLKTLQSTVSGVSSPVYTAPEHHLGLGESQVTKLSAKQSAKCDVYGLGSVLVELFARSRQRLTDVLPDDLFHYYKDRFEALVPDRKRGSTTSARVPATVAAKQSSQDAPLGFDLDDFELPPVVVPAVRAAVALESKRRVTMSKLRDLLSRALTQAEKQDDGDDILYLTQDEVKNVDSNLIIKNLIKGTENIYKITLSGVPVAVKALGSVALTGALKTEVKMLQELSKHECVVGFLGAGFSERLGWFLCMEYVPNTLTELCFRKPMLPLGLRLQMAIDMAQGFRDLHARGVFHRDIKPHNVLVTSSFKIKICDFGISQTVKKVGQAPGATRREITIAHAGILGTPAYMSPEQHLGGVDLKRLSPMDTQRIDVFAFGVMLLELFTGVKLASQLKVNQLKQYYQERANVFHNAEKKVKDSGTRAFESKLMDSKCEPRLLSIVNRCAAFLPEHRPLMSEVHSLLRLARHRRSLLMDSAEGRTARTTTDLKERRMSDSVRVALDNITGPEDSDDEKEEPPPPPPPHKQDLKSVNTTAGSTVRMPRTISTVVPVTNTSTAPLLPPARLSASTATARLVDQKTVNTTRGSTVKGVQTISTVRAFGATATVTSATGLLVDEKEAEERDVELGTEIAGAGEGSGHAHGSGYSAVPGRPEEEFKRHLRFSDTTMPANARARRRRSAQAPDDDKEEIGEQLVGRTSLHFV